MFRLLSLRVSYLPCYVEVSLDSKLEPIFSTKKKKNSRRFFKEYCVERENITYS